MCAYVRLIATSVGHCSRNRRDYGGTATVTALYRGTRCRVQLTVARARPTRQLQPAMRIMVGLSDGDLLLCLLVRFYN